MSSPLQSLIALLPPERLLVRPEQLAAYESDGLTAFRTTPLAVAMPETAEEVIALVRFCRREHAIRGARQRHEFVRRIAARGRASSSR